MKEGQIAREHYSYNRKKLEKEILQIIKERTDKQIKNNRHFQSKLLVKG